jgi:hypothetical protein
VKFSDRFCRCLAWFYGTIVHLLLFWCVFTDNLTVFNLYRSIPAPDFCV